MANNIVNIETGLMDFAYTEFMGHGEAYKIRNRDVMRHKYDLHTMLVKEHPTLEMVKENYSDSIPLALNFAGNIFIFGFDVIGGIVMTEVPKKYNNQYEKLIFTDKLEKISEIPENVAENIKQNKAHTTWQESELVIEKIMDQDGVRREYGVYTSDKDEIVRIKLNNNHTKWQESKLEIKEIMDRDGVVREYGVYRLETGQTAIAGEIYIPIDPTNANLHITWKGTDDGAGVSADVFQEAPGEHSYRKREGLILKQINDAVGLVKSRSGSKPNLHITGHSLGGAVSGMCHNSILRGQAYNLANKLINSGDSSKIEVATKLLESNEKYSGRMDNISKAHITQLSAEQRNNLSDLGEIFLGTWNSACVNPAVQENSLELLKLLNNQGTNYVHRVGLVAGDAVPTAGSYQYLSGASTDGLDQNLLKIHAGVYSGYNRTMAETAGGAVTGASIGTVCGPVGALVGGAVGFVATGLLAAGGKTFLAHTASHFAIDAETNVVNLTRSTEKVKLYKNTNPEDKLAIDSELKFTSGLVHNVLIARKAAKIGDTFKSMFKASKKGKILTQLPKGKNLLDIAAAEHNIRTHFVNKYNH